jgi:predicted acyltransferase
VPTARLESLDIARGLTVAAMILVNDPGDPQHVYPALRHADWNGYTFADLVFPNFLFLSGASLALSLAPRVELGSPGKLELTRALARRSVNLLMLKFFIAQVPTFRRRRIRVFGVLFRTALLSFVAGSIVLQTRRSSTLLKLSAVLLVAYYGALRIPFGSLNTPFLDPDSNLAAALDRQVAHLFHGHLHNGALYNVTHDPEGLLSSIPALATVLLGAAAALTLRSPGNPAGKATTLALAGAASLAAGAAWHPTFPINKNLWTSSYTLVSAGWSLLALAALYTVYDTHKPSRTAVTVAQPAKILGSNAIVAYALSVVGHKLTRAILIPHQGHRLSLRTYTYRKLFARKHSTPLRSLAFAVVCVTLSFLPNLLLHRRKIFIKI